MSRDKKEHAQDVDGLERNVREFIEDTAGVVEHVKAENAKGSHDPAMNALTEAARKDPKWTMHAVVIVIAILAIALGVALLI